MTVNTKKITSGPYVGNNIADTFSYTFKVDDKTQLSVYETTDLGLETLLVVDTDYTVSGVGDDGGGTILRTAGALPTDYQWYIRSNYEETQLTAFSSQGPFFPDVHEFAMDKLTLLIQQLLDRNDRSPRLPDSYSGPIPLSLDIPFAGFALRWNGAEDGLENYDPSTVSNEVIGADKPVINYSTLLVAINDNNLKLNQACNVKERTAGNGGSAMWDVVLASSVVINTYSIVQCVGVPTLALVLRYSSLINLNQLGLGGVDDGPAINHGLSLAACVIEQGTYNIKTKLDFQNSLTGLGYVIFQQVGFISRLGEFPSDNVKIKNITFKGSLVDGVTEVTNHYLVIPTLRKGVVIEECIFTDLKGVTSNQQYALEINLEGTDVDVINCQFNNIQQVGTNPPQEGISPGFCGGIFCQDTGVPVVSAPRIKISGCTFSNIETVRHPDDVSGNPLDFDSDAIRFFATQTDYETSVRNDVLVENCRFFAVQKRCIKNSGMDGLVVDGLTVVADNTSDATRPAMASIVSIQPGKNCKITNVNAVGKFSYLFRVTCANTEISNIKFDRRYSGYCYYFIGMEDRGTLVEKNIKVSNCQILGAARVYRAIDGATGGGSSKEILDNIVFKDIEFGYHLDASDPLYVGHIFKIEHLKDSLFQNIDIYSLDGSEVELKGILAGRCENVTLDNVTLPCSEIGLEIDDSIDGTRVTKDWTIKNSTITREGGVEPNNEFIEGGTNNTGFKFLRNTFYVGSTFSDSNLNFVRLRGSDTVFDGNTVNAYQYGSNAFFPFSMMRFEGVRSKTYNHTMITDGTDGTYMLEIGVGGTDAQVINCHSDQRIVTIGAVGQALMNCSSDEPVLSGAGSFTVSGNNLEY